MILWTVALLACAQPEPPLPKDFIRGMSFAHVHSRAWGYGSERAQKELVRLRELGVTWISISPFAYQPRVDQPMLRYGFRDPTMLQRDLVQVITHAHELGIQVLLKPHIWSNQYWSEGKWNGDIAMDSPEALDEWWSAYSGYILEQAELAERARADGFSVGLELVRLTRPAHSARWRALIQEVRKRYRGPLTYGANHGGEVEQIDFWDALDAIGVHAYYPLGAELESANAADIARAWAPILDGLEELSRRYARPVVLTEIGYPSHRGALAEPWKSDGGRALDEGVQARAYEGAMRAFSGRSFIRGVFIWKWFSGGRDNPDESDPFDPSHKAAERVLARWFAPPR